MAVIDNKIVELKFLNSDFMAKVKDTISGLDILKKQMDFKDVDSNLDGVSAGMEKASKRTTLLTKAFDVLKIGAVGALLQIGATITNTVLPAINSFTLGPMKYGFKEYENQIRAIKLVLANTEVRHGATVESVTRGMDAMKEYTDRTIYSFSDLAKALGTLTGSGRTLEDAIQMIQGIGNAGALANASNYQVLSAITMLDRAMQRGYLGLQQYNSIQTSNILTGKNAEEMFVALGKSMGTLTNATTIARIEGGEFRETLKDQWLSADVLAKGIAIMSGNMDEAAWAATNLNAEQRELFGRMGKDALEAATTIRTFSDLQIQLRNGVASAWRRVFLDLIGGFEEATALWSGLNNVLGPVFQAIPNAIHALTSSWSAAGGWHNIYNGFRNIYNGFQAFIAPLRQGFQNVFGDSLSNAGRALAEISAGFERWTQRFYRPVVTATDGIREFAEAMGITENNAHALWRGLQQGTRTLEDVQRQFSQPLEPLDVDGWFGPLTTAALERMLGIDVSNVWSLNQINEGLARQLQEYLGITVDGVFGESTIKAFQEYLGIAVTGVFNSDTIKAFQQHINENGEAYLSDVMREQIKRLSELTEDAGHSYSWGTAEQWTTIFQAIANAGGLVFDVFKAGVDVIRGVASILNDVFGILLGGVGNTFVDVLAFWADLFNAWAGGVREGDALNGMFERTRDVLSPLVVIAENLRTAFDRIKMAAQPLTNAIGGALRELFSFVGIQQGSWFAMIVQGITSAFAFVGRTLASFFNWLLPFVINHTGAFGEELGKVVSAFREGGLEAGFEVIAASFLRFWDFIKGIFSAIGDFMSRHGFGEWFSGITQIRSFSDFVDWLKDGFSRVRNVISEFIGWWRNSENIFRREDGIFARISEFLGGIDPNLIAGLANLAAFAAGAMALAKISKTVSSTIGMMVPGFHQIGVNFGKLMGVMAKRFKPSPINQFKKTLLLVVGVMLALSITVSQMARIPVNDMYRGIGAMFAMAALATTMAIVLMKLMQSTKFMQKSVSKLNSTMATDNGIINGLTTTSSSILNLVALIGMLAKVMRVMNGMTAIVERLGGMEADRLFQGITALLFIISAMVGLIGVIGQVQSKIPQKSMKESIKTMYSVGTTLLQLGGMLALVVLAIGPVLALLAGIQAIVAKYGEFQWTTIVALAVAIGAIIGAMLVFGKIPTTKLVSMSAFIGIVTSMFAIAGILLGVGLAASAIAGAIRSSRLEESAKEVENSWESVLKLGANLVLIVPSLLLVIRGLRKLSEVTKDGGDLKDAGIAILAIGASMALIGGVLLILQQFSWTDGWQGFTAMVAMLAVLATISKILAHFPDWNDAVKSAKGVAILSLSLLPIAAVLGPLSIFSGSFGKLMASVLAITLVLGALTGVVWAMNRMKGIDNATKGAKSMLLMSLAILPIAAALAALSLFAIGGWGRIIASAVSIGLALSGLAVATRILNGMGTSASKAKEKAATLLVMTLSLAPLAAALIALSLFSSGGMIAGAIALSAGLLALAKVTTVMRTHFQNAKDFQGIAVGMIVMTSSLLPLALAMSMMADQFSGFFGVDKVEGAFLVLFGGITILAMLAKKLSSVGSGMDGAKVVAIKMAAMIGGVLSIAIAMTMIGSMPLINLIASALALYKLMEAMYKIVMNLPAKGDVKEASATAIELGSMAGALLLTALALKVLQGYDLPELIASVGALALLMGVMFGIVVLMNKPGIADAGESAVSLVVLASSLAIVAASLMVLAEHPWQKILASAGIMILTLAALVGIALLQEKFGAALETVKGLVIMAAALAVVAASLAIVATFDFEKILAAAVVLVAIVGALTFMSKKVGNPAAVKGLIALAGAVALVAGAIMALSYVPTDKLIISIGALVGILALVVGAILALHFTGALKVLTALTVSMGALVGGIAAVVLGIALVVGSFTALMIVMATMPNAIVRGLATIVDGFGNMAGNIERTATALGLAIINAVRALLPHIQVLLIEVSNVILRVLEHVIPELFEAIGRIILEAVAGFFAGLLQSLAPAWDRLRFWNRDKAKEIQDDQVEIIEQGTVDQVAAIERGGQQTAEAYGSAMDVAESTIEEHGASLRATAEEVGENTGAGVGDGLLSGIGAAVEPIRDAFGNIIPEGGIMGLMGMDNLVPEIQNESEKVSRSARDLGDGLVYAMIGGVRVAQPDLVNTVLDALQAGFDPELHHLIDLAVVEAIFGQDIVNEMKRQIPALEEGTLELADAIADRGRIEFDEAAFEAYEAYHEGLAKYSALGMDGAIEDMAAKVHEASKVAIPEAFDTVAEGGVAAFFEKARDEINNDFDSEFNAHLAAKLKGIPDDSAIDGAILSSAEWVAKTFDLESGKYLLLTNDFQDAVKVFSESSVKNNEPAIRQNAAEIGKWIDENAPNGLGTALQRALDAHVNNAIQSAINRLPSITPAPPRAAGRAILMGLSTAMDAFAHTREFVDSVEEALHYGFNMALSILEDEGSLHPVITPVLNLDEIEKGNGRLVDTLTHLGMGSIGRAAGLQRMFSVRNDEISQGEISEYGSGRGPTYIQNNYSPKALNASEIYRQTENQLARASRRR